VTRDLHKKTTVKWVWLEEYRTCGCSNVAATRKEALGYCPKHGTDRRRITKIPKAMGLGLGYVGS